MTHPERRRTRHPFALAATCAALACAAGLGSGCVVTHKAPADLLPEASAAEASAPLGGEALFQRKREMQRAHADLIHCDATLASLKHRRDKNGLTLFSRFVHGYLGTHVDPMLAGEWQSRHPELTALDANLRFAKTELLIQLGLRRQVQIEIEEIQRRFAGREDMLVDYPFGEQRALGEALDLLRTDKWRG
jgi:hypothetical protein